MNLEREIEKINRSINTSEIIICANDCISAAYMLYGFEYSDYLQLVFKINLLRKKSKTYEEKASFLSAYKQVYRAQLQTYRTLENNIKTNKVRVVIPNTNVTMDGIRSAAEKLYNRSYANGENVYYELLKIAVRRKIAETYDEIRILKYYPHDYINTFSTYNGSEPILRYRNDRIFYKDCGILPTDGDSFSLSFNEKTLDSTKNALIDILAYLNGYPYFLFTENPCFNQKLSGLYYNFDL